MQSIALTRTRQRVCQEPTSWAAPAPAGTVRSGNGVAAMMTDEDREIINDLSARLAAAELRISMLNLLSWSALIVAVVMSLAAVLIAQG